MLLITFLLAFIDIPVSPPVYIAASGTQDAPVVAANGEGFFAVWFDLRPARYGIYGTRLTADGRPLDPKGIYLGDGWPSHVVWSGRCWLVFTTGWPSQALNMAIVDRDGHPSPQRILATDFAGYGAASNGSRTVVVYNDYYTQRSTALVLDENGTTIDRKELPPSPATPPVYHQNLQVASNGDGFYVKWDLTDYTVTGVEGLRLDAHGTPLDTQPTLLQSTDVETSSIYTDGHDYLLTAWLRSTPGTLVRRISADGTIGRRIMRPQWPRLLVWTGDHYATLSVDHSTFILGAVDRDDNPIDVDRTIYVSPRNSGPCAAAANGSNILLVWSEYSPQLTSEDDDDVVMMNVDARNGTVSPKSNLTLAAATQHPSGIAAGNSGFVVAWQEDTDDIRTIDDIDQRRFDSYVARVDATGTPTSIARLNHSDASAIAPRVAWNGSSYDVAWNEAAGRRTILKTNRVAGDGALIDGEAQPFAAAACGYDVDLASNGDVTLLVWTDCTSRDILGARLRNGLPLDSVPLAISHHGEDESGEARARIAWNGAAFVVVWKDVDQERVHIARVTPGLTLLDRIPIVIPQIWGTEDQQYELASSGTESLIIYRGYTARLEARLFGNDGQLSNAIVVATDPSGYAKYWAPAVVWNGGNYFTAWSEPMLAGARVSRSGNVSPRFSISDTAFHPLLASSSNSLLMMYNRFAGEPLYGGSTRAFLRLFTATRARTVAH